MNTLGHAKHYPDPIRAAAAAAHHAWLSSLDCGVQIPRLLAVDKDQLIFEDVGTYHAGPGDLPLLADSLGRVHAAAHRHELSAATLDQPFRTRAGLVIPDFFSSRADVLAAFPPISPTSPVALYKDANIRNFLLTGAGVAVVDFDDLTLAPFGYDLAKLLVSTAMTFGALPEQVIEQALIAYNNRLQGCPATAPCKGDQLQIYAEIHHHLTRRYLHRNGYIHLWPKVRPWHDPLIVGSAGLVEACHGGDHY